MHKAEIVKLGMLNVIKVELEDKNYNDYIITAIYRLQCIKVLTFVENLKVYLELNKNFKRQILLGDVKFKILECNNNSVEYSSLLAEYEFKSGINAITRPNNDVDI